MPTLPSTRSEALACGARACAAIRARPSQFRVPCSRACAGGVAARLDHLVDAFHQRVVRATGNPRVLGGRGGRAMAREAPPAAGLEPPVALRPPHARLVRSHHRPRARREQRRLQLNKLGGGPRAGALRSWRDAHGAPH
eukprot:876032-Prymnesium_polylepis.1